MGRITLLILIFQNIISRLLFISAKNVIEEESCNKKNKPEKPFCYPFGIIGNLCNFTENSYAKMEKLEAQICRGTRQGLSYALSVAWSPERMHACPF